MRFILDLGPRPQIDCDILEKNNMLYVKDRVSQLRINHVFNIFHRKAPEYLCAITIKQEVFQISIILFQTLQSTVFLNATHFT